MKTKPNILIADDEKKMLDILNINLSGEYNIYVAENGMEARVLIEHQPLDLVISDLKMPKMGGRELLDFVKKEFPSLPFVIMTAFGTIEDAVESIKNGAFDYIVKPIKLDELKHVIEHAIHYNALLAENKKLKARIGQLSEYHKFKTVDPKMNKILRFAGEAAKSDANILITGESGSGKQLMAEFIHSMSVVSEGPFVEINAGAIPHDLLESELFGHEKGAFTGAVQTKKGKFELAHNGTLFLDEIGELPLDLQVKLLHIVEQNKLTRVGGTHEIPIHVRLLAATNRDLLKEVEEKRFRNDLYYRLSVISIQIPPLRERQADIPLLAQFFLKKHHPMHGQGEMKIDPEAVDVLMNYHWPGNIRELENIIQQALIFTKEGIITKENLPDHLIQNSYNFPYSKTEFQQLKNKKVEQIVSRLEMQFIQGLLMKADGNITRAASLSGYDRRQLQNLMNKYNINARNYKS
jgi:two-component system NtrC family response regulator